MQEEGCRFNPRCWQSADVSLSKTAADEQAVPWHGGHCRRCVTAVKAVGPLPSGARPCVWSRGIFLKH